MKAATQFISCFCLALFLFSAAPAPAQEQANDKAAAPNKSTESSPPTAGSILTSNQIAALLTQATDEKTQVQLVFKAAFSQRNVSAEEKKRLVKSGKIPLVITCELDEFKEVQGKKLGKRLGGMARLYILDADGKVVTKQSIPLDKMCPS